MDSYLLHGPSSAYEWSDADGEVWEAMCRERDAGRTRLVGVSNVSLEHLEQMAQAHSQLPEFVQNRCFARLGWDRDVRSFCKARKIVYQGFSLLTANMEVVRTSFCRGSRETSACHSRHRLFSASARRIGILPLTGTSNAEHMKQDLASNYIELSAELLSPIEALIG